MPRGDAEKLKADTEDGYTRIADLLLEALIAAPMTAIELRIIMFVIRRTYGWAKQKDPNSGKADVMTAEDIARGLCVSPRTVERPLTGLVRNGILLRMPVEFERRGVRCAYGVNTHLDEWGSGPDWALFRAQLREAQQGEAYTQSSVVPVRWIAYRQYAEERSANTLDSVVTEPAKPSAAGTHDPLIDSSYKQVGGDIPSPEPEPKPDPDRPPSTAHGRKLPDAHMILSNYTALAQAVREVYGKHWQLHQQQDFVADAGAALDEPGCTITEQDAIDALRGDGKPLPGDRGDWWIGKLCKSRAAAARQDPAAATDPILAEFIRLHGQRPEDIFDLQDWSQKLAAFRQERTAVATGAAR